MLNSNQQKAIKLTKGRILVLAGAGSGKTKVITHRIAHLINDLKVNPCSILGLTFTNKAANEMKQRLQTLIRSNKANDVFLSTFHSFCLSILRKEANKIGYSKNFSIYDEKDIQRLILQIAKDTYIDEKDMPSINSITEAISGIKNKNMTLEEFSFDKEDTKVILKELYPKLSLCMKANNAMDFDSILTLTVELFDKSPDVLKKYQEKFKYIMIDEYQDTNPVQYQIAEKLSKKHNNLFVVGDDDQSIYGWRGSCIKHILEFKAEHILKLEQNYRSTTVILNGANALIKNNNLRHDKTLFSENLSNDRIILFHAPSELEEAQAVINKVIQLRKTKNLKWHDIAILYRSNSLSRNLEMSLLNAMWQKDGKWVRSIPYDIYGGIEFSKRREIKDILAYLRLINNFKDQEALFRIINVPRRGISDKTIQNLNNLSKKLKKTIWDILNLIHLDKINTQNEIQSRALHSIKTFVEIILEAKKRFSKYKLSTVLEWLLHKINYKKAIEEEVKSEKARQAKWENALECINAIAQYEEREKNTTLGDFISNTLLFKENLYKKQNSSEDRLQLMTFHSSKGLEFEACFLTGLEDHIIPHEKSSMQTSIEEERRLLYVAMTRAKKFLTLSMSRTRRKAAKPKPSNPSRFLFEIPKNLLKISSWKSLD